MMQVALTAKIQLQVTPEQKRLLDATMDAYRNACNFVSNYIFQTHDKRRSTFQKVLYRTIRNRFGLRSQMAQSVFRTVSAQYKIILETQRKWIMPEFSKPQYDLVWNSDYSLSQEVFSVNTLSGRVKIKYYSAGMEKYFDHTIYSFGTAKLVNKHGKYFLHIPITTDVPEVLDSQICNVVGIDRGINFIVATYDSEKKSKFVNGRPIKQKRAKYKQVRKELQKRGTPSARQRLKAIGQRENRWMQDVNHCVSKALVTQNPKHALFVLEDLTGIHSATEKVRRKDRYVFVSWPFYDLEQKLKYKAALNESAVINVDPRYTSQTCPICGHTEKANRNKKTHSFCCKACGYTSNDDRIGAMNLYRMGITYLTKDSQVPDTVASQHI